MPARDYESQLRAVLSFYYSVVNVTPEGDSIVSEETLEGLGTARSFRSLLQSLFGSLLRVAFPYGYTTPAPEPPPSAVPAPTQAGADSCLDGVSQSRHAGAAGAMPQLAAASAEVSHQQDLETVADVVAQDAAGHGTGTRDSRQRSSTAAAAVNTEKKFTLTLFVPDPGYFLAGAIAGGVSRTATAPLDRLKVYLLVNTSTQTAETAVGSLKQGRLVSAAKNASRPIRDAVREIFRSGGVRGFFAGE
jgi:solute carrier family 25 phosphate transporter 23/24/25/41